MKKFTFMQIIVLSSIFFTIPVKAAQTDIIVNGEPIKETAVVENGETLLPMRAVLEKLGASISWNNEKKCAEAVRNGEYISFNTVENKIESGIISDINGHVPVSIEDKELIVIDGRIYIPFSAAATLTRCTIEEENGIYISLPTDAESWIYYASWSDGGHMYKIDSNGQNRQKLSDNDCYNLRHADGYIYYSIRGEDEDKLYRIKTDGTGEEKIIDKKAYPEGFYDKENNYRYITDDNCIYYIIAPDKYEQSSKTLCKLNLSTGKETVIAENIDDAAIFQGEIYVTTAIRGESFDSDHVTTIYKIVNDSFEKLTEIVSKYNAYIRVENNETGKKALICDTYEDFTYELSNGKWLKREYKDSFEQAYTCIEDGYYYIINNLSDENYELIKPNNLMLYPPCVYYRKTGTDEIETLIEKFSPNCYYRENNTLYLIGCEYINSTEKANFIPSDYMKSIIINLDNPEDKQEIAIDLSSKTRTFNSFYINPFKDKKITYEENNRIYCMNFDGSEKMQVFPPTKYINEYSGNIIYSPLLKYESESPKEFTLWKRYKNGQMSQITNEYTKYYKVVNK